jgi:hypothetical protein
MKVALTDGSFRTSARGRVRPSFDDMENVVAHGRPGRRINPLGKRPSAVWRGSLPVESASADR